DVTVMIERCGHETGPLGEGEVRRIDGSDCVVCPWHGSTFRLTDGIAIHGPASTPQPLLRSRVRDGLVGAALPRRHSPAMLSHAARTGPWEGRWAGTRSTSGNHVEQAGELVDAVGPAPEAGQAPGAVVREGPPRPS